MEKNKEDLSICAILFFAKSLYKILLREKI